MKKIRYKNWLVLISILVAYIIMGYHNGYFGGFLQLFLLASSLAIIIGELYWIISGKEIKGYILGDSESHDEYLG